MRRSPLFAVALTALFGLMNPAGAQQIKDGEIRGILKKIEEPLEEAVYVVLTDGSMVKSNKVTKTGVCKGTTSDDMGAILRAPLISFTKIEEKNTPSIDVAKFFGVLVPKSQGGFIGFSFGRRVELGENHWYKWLLRWEQSNMNPKDSMTYQTHGASWIPASRFRKFKVKNAADYDLFALDRSVSAGESHSIGPDYVSKKAIQVSTVATTCFFVVITKKGARTAFKADEQIGALAKLMQLKDKKNLEAKLMELAKKAEPHMLWRILAVAKRMQKTRYMDIVAKVSPILEDRAKGLKEGPAKLMYDRVKASKL